MTDREIDDLLEKLERVRRETSKDKVSATAFLIRAGILTDDEKMAAPYQHLCIASEPA